MGGWGLSGPKALRTTELEADWLLPGAEPGASGSLEGPRPHLLGSWPQPQAVGLLSPLATRKPRSW